MAVKDVSYIFNSGTTYSFEYICKVVVEERSGIQKGEWENFVKKRRDYLFDFMKVFGLNGIFKELCGIGNFDEYKFGAIASKFIAWFLINRTTAEVQAIRTMNYSKMDPMIYKKVLNDLSEMFFEMDPKLHDTTVKDELLKATKGYVWHIAIKCTGDIENGSKLLHAKVEDILNIKEYQKAELFVPGLEYLLIQLSFEVHWLNRLIETSLKNYCYFVENEGLQKSSMLPYCLEQDERARYDELKVLEIKLVNEIEFLNEKKNSYMEVVRELRKKRNRLLKNLSTNKEKIKDVETNIDEIKKEITDIEIEIDYKNEELIPIRDERATRFWGLKLDHYENTIFEEALHEFLFEETGKIIRWSKDIVNKEIQDMEICIE